MIPNKNIYTTKTDIGPVVILQQDTVELYASKIIFLSTKFDLFKYKVIIISWIREKGIKYSFKNNMTVVLNLCEENNINNMLPYFGLIKSIFLTDSTILFSICKKFKILYTDKHYQVYSLNIPSNFVCILLNS